MKAGWEMKSLGEVCQIARGGSPRPIQDYITNDADGVNWIKISDATASGKFIYVTKEKIKPTGISRSRLVKPGDFLLSNSMSFGRPYIMQTTGCIHDGWLVLSEYERLFDQGFLYHLLGSPLVFEQFDKLAAGSTVRNLNIELASRVLLPVPPLPEQQRIVTLLDAAFAGITTARAHTEQNLRNARELFESQLAAVFSQRGAGWVETTLGSAFDVRDGTHDSPKYHQTGFPLITSKNLKQEGLSFENIKLISAQDFKKINERSAVHKGDVLFAMIGTIGNPTLVTVEPNFAIKNVALFKNPHGQNTTFLQHYLSSSFVTSKMLREAKGTTQKFVGLGYLRSFPINLPTLETQAAVVKKLDAAKAQTQRLEFLYQSKLAALDELKQSLLQQAFSGQL